MDIEFSAPFQAQPLDDEGDPVGKVIKLPAGTYRLSGPVHDDGTAWVRDQTGRLYEAHNVRAGLG
jgi:hypothetical protein